jgi:hypothetical protein
MMSGRQAKPLTPARVHERRALHAVARKEFVPIGSFVSAASRAHLLAVLKQLKPKLNMRLRVLGSNADTRNYQVEIEAHELRRPRQIDPWLGIKGALKFAFPADKPGAVRRLQP